MPRSKNHIQHYNIQNNIQHDNNGPQQNKRPPHHLQNKKRAITNCNQFTPLKDGNHNSILESQNILVEKQRPPQKKVKTNDIHELFVISGFKIDVLVCPSFVLLKKSLTIVHADHGEYYEIFIFSGEIIYVPKYAKISFCQIFNILMHV